MLIQTVASAFIRALPQLISAVWQMIQGLFQGLRLALIELLSGKPNEIVAEQADKTEETAKNQKQVTKNIKETNKELKKTLAGFDEIQTLSSQAADGADESIDAELQGIGGPMSGDANAILDGSAIAQTVSDTFIKIASQVSGWLMALGCILLVTGNIGWGIGLIIAGAIGSEYAEAQVGDGSSLNELIDTITNALIIAGVVAILLGILLCTAQMWGIGIKLISIGAISVVGSVALNWDSIKEKLQGSFGDWLAVGGIVAIILGILLCFTPMLPLGIGLIALGAAAVVAPIVANWDTIWNTITTTFEKITNWIQENGLFMVIVGLLLFGVNPAIAIALIYNGIKGMVEGKDDATNAIVNWVKNAWEAVKAFWNKYIAPVFTWKWWANLAVDAGNGLIRGFEFIVNGIITMFENMINFVVNGINSIGFDIPAWLGGGRFGFNIPKVQFGRISMPKIPRLAQGTVIPGGREFMAILGDQPRGQTNIEAPLDTIVEAFNIALSQRGNSNGFNGRIEVPVIVSGREIARAVRESEQDMGKQTVFGGFANAY
jgi:hypothetical protein